MNERKIVDLAMVGGGIVGLSTAKHIAEQTKASILLLEAEQELGLHQTGNNSGVIHAGLYYKPGSSKARHCAAGREALYAFCEEQGIAHDRCGKLVVAVNRDQIPALEELERRGAANGLKGIQRLGAEQLKEHEPYVTGVMGLKVPQTGIVDFPQVAQTYARQVEEAGGQIIKAARLLGVKTIQGSKVLETTNGEVHAKNIINCAGLHADRVAKLCGVDPHLQIIPFRGEYYELVEAKHHLVRHLIYPVPDPRFPFLGVHFTRMIHGGVEAGPNAVLALAREGYRWRTFSPRDLGEMMGYKGFWNMARKYWRSGFSEVYRSLCKKAFVHALQQLVPEVTGRDVAQGGAGVRAQAVLANGKLVDDFRILEDSTMIHVLNAPSPAATASLAIGQTIAGLAEKNFGLQRR